MTKEPNNHKEPHLKKQASPRNQRLSYIVFPKLIIVFFGLVLVFQNCSKSINGPFPSQKVISDYNEDSITSKMPSSTMMSSTQASKAIFNISEEQGNTISNILWQVRNQPCHGESEVIATGTDVSLEIDRKSAINISVEALIQFEGQECITYEQREFQDTDIICTAVYTFEDFKRDHNPWEILAAPSDDEMNVGHDFSVGSVVGLEFVGEEHEWEGELNPLNFLDFASFKWSIKDARDQIELADQTNTTKNLTYAFSQIGVYNVSVKANLADDDMEDEQFSEDPHEQELYNEIVADGEMTRDSRLVIGKCEEEDVVDIEVSFE